MQTLFPPKKLSRLSFLYRAITCIYSQINGVACNAKKKIEGAFDRVSKPLEELKKASKKVTVSIWVVGHFSPDFSTPYSWINNSGLKSSWLKSLG